MPKKRSEISIFVEILRFIFDSRDMAKPTHIMYKANLSHKTLKTYMGKMMADGLVSMRDLEGKSYFSLTDKGRKFLIGYKKVRVFSDAFGIDI
jgi:predicted transcriptional regulator